MKNIVQTSRSYRYKNLLLLPAVKWYHLSTHHRHYIRFFLSISINRFAMSALNLKTAASLMVHLLLVPTTVEGFQHYHRVSICHLASSSSTAERGNTVLFNTQGDDNDDDDWSSSLPLSKSPTPFSQQLEQGKFNPLDYRGKSKTNRSSGSAQAQVNLRSMRMSSMTDDLLNSLGNKAAMRAVLEENRDFLLEPLESEETLAVR